MILDLERFIAEEKPKWERLDKILDTLSADPYKRLSLTEIRELELLYQRSSSDLARLSALSVGR